MDAISAMMEDQRKDPREATDPHERAYRWWRLAMNKIKEQNKKRKTIALGNVRRLGGGDDLDELYDSEEHEQQDTSANTENETDGEE